MKTLIQKDSPIIVAGFGRSGTTWISDILSKVLGSLILFEPDHPRICDRDGKYLYSRNLNKLQCDDFFHAVINGQHRDTWLLRNHLLSDELKSSSLIDAIWENSRIIGFKCIRWNFDLPFLEKLSRGKLVFVLRNPLAVIASLLNRPNFFEDYGWSMHWNIFKKRNPYKEIEISRYDTMGAELQYAVLWTVSNIAALESLEALKIKFWPYEAFYLNPYDKTRELLQFLKIDNKNIHPSHIFYPSMATLRTFHTKENFNWHKEESLDMFWKDQISDIKAREITSVIKSIVKEYPRVESIFRRLKYL